MLRSVALSLALAGCSVAIVRGAPDPAPPPGTPLRCTTSPIGPIVDTVIAAGTLAGAIYFAASGGDDAELGASIEAGLAIGFGVSAVTGWRRIARCRGLQHRMQ